MNAQHPTSLVPLRSATGGALIAGTFLASMVAFVDASVVNVAVPAIGRDLHPSVTALQWTLTSYPLSAAGLLLLSGALADRFGRRRRGRLRPGRGINRQRRGIAVGALVMIAVAGAVLVPATAMPTKERS